MKKLGVYLLLLISFFAGAFVVLTVIETKAAWQDMVNSGDPLTDELWNDVVAKLIDLDNRTAVVDTRTSVYGTIRVDVGGVVNSSSGLGFTASNDISSARTSCVMVNFNNPFSATPHVITAINSTATDHYQWSTGSYSATTNNFRLCLTYTNYSSPNDNWGSGWVGVSFIAIGT